MKEWSARQDDWFIHEDGTPEFTPVMLDNCPACGRRYGDPDVYCYQPDPTRTRMDWQVRNCNMIPGAIYANGQKVGLWGDPLSEYED